MKDTKEVQQYILLNRLLFENCILNFIITNFLNNASNLKQKIVKFLRKKIFFVAFHLNYRLKYKLRKKVKRSWFSTR